MTNSSHNSGPVDQDQSTDTSRGSGRVREGADRACNSGGVGTSPALKSVVGGLVAVLFVCTIIVGKSLITTTRPATADVGVSTAPASTNTDSNQAVLEGAVRMLNAGQFTQAASVLEKVTQRTPTDQAARVAYAQALIGLKSYVLAYEQYEAAIALAGPEATLPMPAMGKVNETSKVAVARNPTGALLNFEAGTCAMMADKVQRAQEHYSTAQQLDPNEAKYPLYLAMSQIKLGDDSAAMASLLRAVKLKPELAEGWGTMAEVELRRNQTALALQHIGEARKLQPEVTRWRMVEARGMNRIGEPEKALALLSALDPATRVDPSVLALMAESFGLLKKPGEAAAMYADAVKVKPSDAELNYQAASWYERAGETGKAKPFAKMALTLGHEHAGEMVGRLDGTAVVPRD